VGMANEQGHLQETAIMECFFFLDGDNRCWAIDTNGSVGILALFEVQRKQHTPSRDLRNETDLLTRFRTNLIPCDIHFETPILLTMNNLCIDSLPGSSKPSNTTF
jgi:hypothetical protein